MSFTMRTKIQEVGGRSSSVCEPHDVPPGARSGTLKAGADTEGEKQICHHFLIIFCLMGIQAGTMAVKLSPLYKTFHKKRQWDVTEATNV